jgi:hypothetical protein
MSAKAHGIGMAPTWGAFGHPGTIGVLTIVLWNPRAPLRRWASELEGRHAKTKQWRATKARFEKIAGNVRGISRQDG